MNEFNEDTWSPEQCALDGRICLEFEALESSRAIYEETGLPTEAWLASAVPQAEVIRTAVSKLEHEGRRQHWERELQRIGVGTSVAEKAADKATEDAETKADAKTEADEVAAEIAADDAADAAAEDRAEAASAPSRRPRRGG